MMKPPSKGEEWNYDYAKGAEFVVYKQFFFF